MVADESCDLLGGVSIVYLAGVRQSPWQALAGGAVVQPGDENQRKSVLERHWPLAVSALALVILCFTYFAVYTVTPRSPGRALVLTVVPNLVATLAIAVCLYVLLNRDFRAMHSGASSNELETLRYEMEQMSTQIRGLAERGGALRRRSSLPPLEEFLGDAEVISIAAVSGLGLINHYRGLLEAQLQSAKRIRVLLLDLERPDALAVWDRLSNPPMNSPEDDIRSGTRQFLGLTDLSNLPGRCEVKLIDTLLPYSLIIAQGKHGGAMQVELHSYRRAPEQRPDILLSSESDPQWFSFFLLQFNEAWANSKSPRR